MIEGRVNMLRFKVDVLPMLKSAGYPSTRLRDERIFGGATINKMRHRQIVSMNELHRICRMLDKQPGELIEFIPDD